MHNTNGQEGGNAASRDKKTKEKMFVDKYKDHPAQDDDDYR